MGCAPSVHVCGQDHAVATRSAQEIAHVERAPDDAAERELLDEAPGVPSVLRPSSFGVGSNDLILELSVRAPRVLRSHPLSLESLFRCRVWEIRGTRALVLAALLVPLAGFSDARFAQISTLLGVGGFARVFAARRRDTGEAVAVKQYDKRACLTVSGGLDMLFRERDILLHLSAPRARDAAAARAAGGRESSSGTDESESSSDCDERPPASSPGSLAAAARARARRRRRRARRWVSALHGAFQDENHCYLVCDLLPGGDLRYRLERTGPLEEEEARFYVASVALSLRFLHAHGVLHRDVKPENVLLDARGYCRLADFGISDHCAAAQPPLRSRLAR